MSTQARVAKPFGRGIPTEPDVDRLIRKYGAPKPGLIYYKDIEKALQLHRQMPRFFTVLNVWRKKLLEEYNIATLAAAGEGIRILDEDDRVYAGASMLHRSARTVMRAVEWADRIDDDKLKDDASKSRLKHVVKVGKAIRSVVTDGMKTLIETAPKELKK